MYIEWNPIKVKRVAVKPCPNCGSTHISKGNIVSNKLPNWWYVVCEDCGYTTEDKLFLRRAVKCWNKHSRDHIFSDSDIDFSDY